MFQNKICIDGNFFEATISAIYTKTKRKFSSFPFEHRIKATSSSCWTRAPRRGKGCSKWSLLLDNTKISVCSINARIPGLAFQCTFEHELYTIRSMEYLRMNVQSCLVNKKSMWISHSTKIHF